MPPWADALGGDLSTYRHRDCPGLSERGAPRVAQPLTSTVLAGTLKQHKPSALATATTRASGERPRLSRDENVFRRHVLPQPAVVARQRL